MKNKIEKFLNDYKLTAGDNTIVVGFSGGFDSLALLDVINSLSEKYHFNVLAAHLNHNWRGEESLQEQINCKNYCNDKNIEFYTETLDENEKHTETRARELRYQFFYNVINKFNADALLTAHTKSDTAETLVYRVIKGTGIKGLQGISPKLDKIYRPMLDISRTEIEEYCKNNGLNPNNDSSNQNNKYARNFIRNKVLPLFREINPQAENSINTLSVLAYEEEQIIKEYIQCLNLYDGEKLKTDIFKKISYYLQKRLIYEFYVKYDIEYSIEKIQTTLDFILDNINSKAGKKCSLDKTHWLYISSKFIEVIGESKKDTTEVIINKEGTYKFGDWVFTIEKEDKIPSKFPSDTEFKAYVCLDKNMNYILRTRRNGDIIQPLGSHNLTKLKKYFMNKNIPQHKKDSIILLCKDSEILWASGYGINDKIKVVNKCTHVLTLKKIGD